MQHTVFGVPLTVTKARGDGREPGTSITPPGHPLQAHSQPHQNYGRDEEEDPVEATTLKATYTAGSPTPSSRHGSFSSSTLSVAIISRSASSCASELNLRRTSPESLALSPPVDGLQRHRANGGQASAFRPSQPTSLHPAQSLRTSAGSRNSLPNFRSDPLGRLGAPIARAPAGPREEGCSGSSGRDGGFEASTVAIRGLRRSTSLDALRSYFDNTRMSGGGEVLDVRLSPVVDGTAFVSFRHEQDAANVKARGHKLEDKDLKVVDVVKNQLLLGSLPHCVSEDLRHFVEVKASSALERVKFGEDGSVAIVTFEEEIALQHIRDSLTAQSFKGKTLHVEPVPVTDTILVRNLPRAPLLTEESLENLFSNTRYSGGQDVTSVTLNVGNNYAQIAFADPSVASRVAGRKIQYHQRELDISLFNDCLGPSGGLAEQPLKKPQPKQITEVECVKKISLLTKVPCLASRLRDVLEQCHARLDLPDNAGEGQQVSLVCTLSADVEGAPCLAASWTEDATNALNDHLQRSVYVKSEPLNADAGGGGGGVTWVQNLADEAGVGAVFDEKAGTVYVLCDRDESRMRVDAVIARIQAENRKRCEAKITLQVPIAKGKLPLLKSHHVGKEVKEKFPELCVAFDMDNACVRLEGAEEAVSAMRASIEEVSGLIKSKAHRWNSPTASLLPSSAESRNAVEMACRKESSEGTVHFNDSGFEVHSFCEEEAEKMLSRGADAVKEKIIQIDEGLKTALELPEWEDFRKSMVEESEGLLQFVQTDASLTVIGVGPTAHDRFKAVEEFLEEHVRLKRTIALGMPFHAVLQTLLRKKHEDDHLRVHDFALGKNACEVVVEGNKGGIQAVEELAKELTNLSALPQE